MVRQKHGLLNKVQSLLQTTKHKKKYYRHTFAQHDKNNNPLMPQHLSYNFSKTILFFSGYHSDLCFFLLPMCALLWFFLLTGHRVVIWQEGTLTITGNGQFSLSSFYFLTFAVTCQNAAWTSALFSFTWVQLNKWPSAPQSKVYGSHCKQKKLNFIAVIAGSRNRHTQPSSLAQLRVPEKGFRN